MLKGLEMSELWLPSAMQAWKSINFVYVLLKRLSYLWQVQCVMFLVALNESIVNVIKDLQVYQVCEWAFLQKEENIFLKSIGAGS